MSNDKSGGRGAYDVGYGKPPKRTRFKKGQSGNHKGRPRKPKTVSREVADILNEPVVVTTGRERRNMPAFEASVRRLVQRTIKNRDLAAMMAFVKLCELHGAMKPQPVEQGGGVIFAPPGVDFREWLDANTELGPACADDDE